MKYAWNVKTEETPITIGPNGTISNSFRKYLINITGKHDVKDLQKTAILLTVHVYVPGEVLKYTYKTIIMGITVHVLYVVNTEYLLHCVPQKQHRLFQTYDCEHPVKC